MYFHYLKDSLQRVLMSFDSTWVTELWYLPPKQTLSREPNSLKFAVFGWKQTPKSCYEKCIFAIGIFYLNLFFSIFLDKTKNEKSGIKVSLKTHLFLQVILTNSSSAFNNIIYRFSADIKDRSFYIYSNYSTLYKGEHLNLFC